MKSRTNDQDSSKPLHVALWALQLLTAAAFFMAGLAKLSGQQMMVETFDKVGMGQWFRYVTGGIEVASAILLLTPRLSAVGAALLVATMSGAVLSHLFFIGGSPAAALILLSLAAAILWGRFGALKAMLVNLRALAVPAPDIGDAVISRSLDRQPQASKNAI